jgi:hypothetical protein
MNTSTPVIEVKELARRYGRVDAVDGLNLRVERGRCYGFFGRNGAGKTTTIKCLLNLLKPDGGSVRLFGLDPPRDEVEVKSRLISISAAHAVTAGIRDDGTLWRWGGEPGRFGTWEPEQIPVPAALVQVSLGAPGWNALDQEG